MAVGRSENPEVPVLFGGHNLPLLVDIGLTDLPKFGGAMATPGTTPLQYRQRHLQQCSGVGAELNVSEIADGQ